MASIPDSGLRAADTLRLITAAGAYIGSLMAARTVCQPWLSTRTHATVSADVRLAHACGQLAALSGDFSALPSGSCALSVRDAQGASLLSDRMKLTNDKRWRTSMSTPKTECHLDR